MKLAETQARRGTRSRAVPMIGAGLAALAAMFGAVSANVLAVNFTTMDNQFQVYSNYLDAKYAAGFLAASTRKAATNTTCNGSTTATAQCGVAEIGINTASLAGLCAVVPESINFPGVGSLPYYLLLTAGQGVNKSITSAGSSSIPTPQNGTLNVSSTDGTIMGTSTGIVTAKNLYLSTPALAGYGNLISGLNLGQDAASVANSAGLNGGTPGTAGSWPNGSPTAGSGNFGLYATQLNVAALYGGSYGINLAGSITLPNLNIQVKAGSAPTSSSGC